MARHSNFDGVRKAYPGAADKPRAEQPFPVGRHFAASLEYLQDWLDNLPAVSVESLAGLSNVALFADIPPGAQVLAAEVCARR